MQKCNFWKVVIKVLFNLPMFITIKILFELIGWSYLRIIVSLSYHIIKFSERINIFMKENLFSGATLSCTALYGLVRIDNANVKLDIYLSFHFHLVWFNLINLGDIYIIFFKCEFETLNSRVWIQEMAFTCNFTARNLCPLVKCK